MKYYNLEISKIEGIEHQYEKLSDKQLVSFLYEVVGIALINIQKTEFIIHGIVSHFNENLLQTNKNFKKLTPRIFLDNDKKSQNLRRQTLGAIINFVLETTDLFNQDELNKYVANRNKFVHNFWREYLSHNKINNRTNVLEALNFLVEFMKDDEKWQTIFKGFLYAVTKSLSERYNKDMSNFMQFEKNYKDFLEYVKVNKI